MKEARIDIYFGESTYTPNKADIYSIYMVKRGVLPINKHKTRLFENSKYGNLKTQFWKKKHFNKKKKIKIKNKTPNKKLSF